MANQRVARLGLLGRRTIVGDGVNGVVGRQFGPDDTEEEDELLVAVALHVAPDHRSI